MLETAVYSGPGQTTETVGYTYDSLNRQSTVTDSAHGPTPTSFTYDPVTQNVASIASPEGTINYVYNPVTGHEVRMIVSHGGTVTDETDYAYDAQGRLTHVYGVIVRGTFFATFATSSDGNPRPGIVNILRATAGRSVRFHEAVDPTKLRVIGLVNGAPITESQRSALLDSICGMSTHLTPSAMSDSERSAATHIRGASITGIWNCESRLLTRLEKLGRKVPWSLQLTLVENEVRGTSWYASPAPGADRRQVTGTVRGEFIPEGGYLRLEWWVSDPRALGFGYHLLRLSSNGLAMEGFGIGHSSEGEGMFAVATKCTKEPEPKGRKLH